MLQYWFQYQTFAGIIFLSVIFLRLAAPHPIENGFKHRFRSRLEKGPGSNIK